MTKKVKNIRSPWSLGKHSGFILMLSFGINLLGLVGAIYMMQVYDRVLSSGSVPTLVGISIIALILYLFLGCLDYLRTAFLSAHGESFADKHAPKAFQTALNAHARDSHKSGRRYAVEDLGTIRQFITSKGYSSIFDVMWTPVFLFFIFSLHMVLGVTALVATVFLIGVALLKERISRKRVEAESERISASRQGLANIQRHAQLVIANGMSENMAQKWMASEKTARIDSLNFSSLSAKYTVSSKTIRMIVQSMILGLGGFLAIKGHISPGAMIAASIVFTRTISPVERLLANFALLTRARQSWARVKTWISADIEDHKISLPVPSEKLETEIGYLVPPGAKQPVLKNVKFALKSGDVLGVVGPSGSGKSSLAKALSGAWMVQNGSVALDGADYPDWRQDQLGAAIGYMAQDCQLFDGTVAENIAGFLENFDENTVIHAAMTACAHEMILGLPQGYNTPVGPTGISLSAGQRQRINLARALFGNPFVIVLDEPNSNLDDAGETALLEAVKNLKDAGKIVIIVAHRKKILKHATKLCVIKNGTLGLFGPAKAVAEKLMGSNKAKTDKPVKRAQPSNRTPVLEKTLEQMKVEKAKPSTQKPNIPELPPQPGKTEYAPIQSTPVQPDQAALATTALRFNAPPNPYLNPEGVTHNAS